MEYLKLNNWKDQKIEYYGRTRSWSQMGSAISSLIAGFIVFSAGTYENIFLYSCIPYVFNFIVVLSYPSHLNFTSEKKKKEKKSILVTHKHFWQMMKKPEVLRIINTTAIHSAYIKAIKDYIQPLMVNLALATPILLSLETDKKKAIFIGIIYFIIYLLTSRASAISSKFDKKYKSKLPYLTLIIGFGFGAISGFFYIQDIWPIAVISFIGIYIIENIRKPVLTGYAAEHAANEVLTSVLSAQSFLKTVMTAILAFVFGFLADQFSIGVSLLVVSALLTFGTIIIHLLGEKRISNQRRH